MEKEAIINHENKTVEFFVLSDICGYGTTSQAYFENILTGIGSDYTVKIYINSYGGDVKEGIGISATLKRCPAKIIAYVDCFACSAASVLLLGADEIYIPKNASMMLHDGSWWTYGNPRELRKSADDLDVINEQVINSYALRTGDKLSKESIRQIMADATWISAEDCVKYGLADGYTDYDADIQKAAEQFKAAAQTGAAAYAKAPAQIAALLKLEPEQPQTPPPPGPGDNHKPQAGAPVNKNGSLAERLLNAMKKTEV